jgi:hypothetical protein
MLSKILAKEEKRKNTIDWIIIAIFVALFIWHLKI